MNLTKNNKGQGLVEYLIIVALIGVAAMGVMGVLQQSIKSQYSNIINSIQGGKKAKIQSEAITGSDYKKRDLSDFMHGSNKR